MAERVRVSLACTECQSRNYKTTRKLSGASEAGEPLSLKKYCPQCNRHTVHKETK